MSAIYQLDLFLDENEIKHRELILMKESMRKMQKCLFAKHGDLAKEFLSLRQEVEFLKQELRGRHEFKVG